MYLLDLTCISLWFLFQMTVGRILTIRLSSVWRSTASCTKAFCLPSTHAASESVPTRLALVVQTGYKLGTNWVQTGYKLGTNWVQTGYKLGTNWVHTVHNDDASHSKLLRFCRGGNTKLKTTVCHKTMPHLSYRRITKNLYL